MSEPKGTYETSKHGGPRPGSGRKKKLKDTKYIKVYVDAETIAKLKRISNNQSEAVRMAAKNYPLS